MELLKKEEIQKIQLEILDVVDAFCKENNFTYYLTGGTLIGALRHNGFIPWDDDIDIIMYRDEYERFIKLFNEKNSKYHVYSIEGDKGYNSHFCKICDKDTYLEEIVQPHKVELGINIDLFPLDKLPENVDEKKILKKLHFLDQFYHIKSIPMKNIKKWSFKQRIKIHIFKILSIFTSCYKLAKKQFDIAQQYRDTETDNYSIITCHIRRKFPTINRSQTVAEYHVFEDRMYAIPSTYDRFLTEQFGDYMTPPPVDKRTSGHSFVAYKK